MAAAGMTDTARNLAQVKSDMMTKRPCAKVTGIGFRARHDSKDFVVSRGFGTTILRKDAMMTDPIDTARADGIALGLAMAKAAPRYGIDDDGCMWKRADGEWIDPADIPEPPIPPQVAAARVLLNDDDALMDLAIRVMRNNRPVAGNRPGYRPALRAALEQIAKENPDA